VTIHCPNQLTRYVRMTSLQRCKGMMRLSPRRFLESFFAASPSRYFRFGMKHVAKIPSGFAREIALEQAMNYVKTCKLGGDYFEFGVFQGRTFAAACYLARERDLPMQFWAFDSFEGLPCDEVEFHAGAYATTRDAFLKNVKDCTGDLSNVHVVPGWFSETLADSNPALAGIAPAAVVWIDCDLYESTRPVLKFLTSRLQDGSLIFFDDWFNFRGRPDCGEQRACNEWLQQTPEIALTEYTKFGWHGQAFIVRQKT
jgi:O-methyltransferase